MALIEILNFEKRFDKKIVHRGVSLSVQRGECLGLIGGSGSGKSVLLRSLIGLDTPDSGKVLIDGKNVSEMPEAELNELTFFPSI